MRLTINGEAQEAPEGLDLAGLLAHLGVPEAEVAVELNEAIVRRGELKGRALKAGDKVEIMRFMGGGR